MGSSACRPPSYSIRAMEAPRGPGRKTKLKPDRIIQGIYVDGGNSQETDKWQNVNEIHLSASHPWTGRTIFMVDKRYSKEYGTDQRRQRATLRTTLAS